MLGLLRMDLPWLKAPIQKETQRMWIKKISLFGFNSIVFFATHLFSQWREKLTTMMNENQSEMCRHCRGEPIHYCLQNKLGAYFPSLQNSAFILGFPLFSKGPIHKESLRSACNESCKRMASDSPALNCREYWESQILLARWVTKDTQKRKPPKIPGKSTDYQQLLKWYLSIRESWKAEKQAYTHSLDTCICTCTVHTNAHSLTHTTYALEILRRKDLFGTLMF